MGDRRARRPTVDYTAISFDDDDDDFVDSSSSSSSRAGSQEKLKKKKNNEKEKEKTKEKTGDKDAKKKSSVATNDENAKKRSKEMKENGGKKSNKELKEVDLNGGGGSGAVRTLESFLSSPSRRGERKSLDERRFERELEMAMKLSKQVPCLSAYMQSLC